ncbi:hypothetical protein H4R21_006199, partial [Coemansia helicoidea]
MTVNSASSGGAMFLPTRCLHSDSRVRATADLTVPISVSTTFEYPAGDVHGSNYPGGQSYHYSRINAPTVAQAEAVLDAITEGHATLYGSGLTASFAVLAEYRPRKIALGECYFGVKNVIEQYKKLVPGVQVVGIDCAYDGVDLVWLESPLNPSGEVKDIQSYALRAHAAGAALVVDATLAPPPLSFPFRQGADVVVHSATKYLGGHSDLLAGVVVSKCPKQTARLHE